MGQILDKFTDIAIHRTKFIAPFRQTVHLVYHNRVHLVLLNCLPQMRIIQSFRCNKERLKFTMCQPFDNGGILPVSAVQAARSDFTVLATLHQITHECDCRKNTNQQIVWVHDNHRKKAN